MNPFQIKTHGTKKEVDGNQTATDLLAQHGYDSTIKDRLLAVALAEEQKHPSRPANDVHDDEHDHHPGEIDPDYEPKAGEPAMPAEDMPPNPHHQIMIAQNFLSDEICDEYIEYIKGQKEIELSVFDPDATNVAGEIQWEVDKKTRDTQTVDIEPIKEVVFDLMKYAVRDFLNPFFGVEIKDSEMPQVLVYNPGGHYRPHIDAEALWHDGSGVLQWVKNVDRDISLVVYLNDDYEGGEIVFPKLALSIKPRKGMLIAFPSDHNYLHGVNPVTKGVRYAIVNWFSLGTKPVHQQHL